MIAWVRDLGLSLRAIPFRDSSWQSTNPSLQGHVALFHSPIRPYVSESMFVYNVTV